MSCGLVVGPADPGPMADGGIASKMAGATLRNNRLPLYYTYANAKPVTQPTSKPTPLNAELTMNANPAIKMAAYNACVLDKDIHEY